MLQALNSIRSLDAESARLLIPKQDVRDVTIEELDRAREVLESCVLIEEQHRCITLDREATRECRDKEGKLHTIQLVFYTGLPAKSITEVTKESHGSSHRFIARTPHPTKEATEAMRAHGHKFDSLQLWWVPNDIMVQRIPDPDPVLVGVRKVPRMGELYFELHRWVDESVEDGWWAREGY